MSLAGESLLVQAFQFETNLRAELSSRLALPADSEQLEDLVQETYARILSSTQQSSPNLAAVKALVFEMLQQVLAERAADIRTPQDDEMARLVAEVQTLPALTRRIFTLRKAYEYSYPEIARALGVSSAEVEQHLVSAAQACSRALFGSPPARPHRGTRWWRWTTRHRA